MCSRWIPLILEMQREAPQEKPDVGPAKLIEKQEGVWETGMHNRGAKRHGKIRRWIGKTYCKTGRCLGNRNAQSRRKAPRENPTLIRLKKYYESVNHFLYSSDAIFGPLMMIY